MSSMYFGTLTYSNRSLLHVYPFTYPKSYFGTRSLPSWSTVFSSWFLVPSSDSSFSEVSTFFWSSHTIVSSVFFSKFLPYLGDQSTQFPTTFQGFPYRVFHSLLAPLFLQWPLELLPSNPRYHPCLRDDLTRFLFYPPLTLTSLVSVTKVLQGVTFLVCLPFHRSFFTTPQFYSTKQEIFLPFTIGSKGKSILTRSFPSL